MKRTDCLHLTTGESLLFINVSTLKSVLAGLMGTELQNLHEEGWSAAWCYDNRARNLLPAKEKCKEEGHSRTGRSTRGSSPNARKMVVLVM